MMDEGALTVVEMLDKKHYDEFPLRDASSQAAHRKEELGYERVYDYEAGKLDWNGAGLPIEP